MEPGCPHLLDLPLELRLHIYYYVLAGSNVITIATATRDRSDPASCPPAPLRRYAPKLPKHQIPVVRCQYDGELLSIHPLPKLKAPARLSFHDSGFFDETEAPAVAEEPMFPHPPSLALKQTCHQIRDELKSQVFRCFFAAQQRASNGPATDGSLPLWSPPDDGLSIFVTYPYGLIVLNHHYRHLLQHARSIHISGYFISDEPNPYSVNSTQSISSQSASRNSSSRSNRGDGSTLTRHPKSVRDAAHRILKQVVSEVMSPKPEPILDMLQLRIYYLGRASSTLLWVDKESPVNKTLEAIPGGDINLEVCRGRLGSGLNLIAKANPSGRKLGTRWKSLSDKLAESEGYVIDPKWPY